MKRNVKKQNIGITFMQMKSQMAITAILLLLSVSVQCYSLPKLHEAASKNDSKAVNTILQQKNKKKLIRKKDLHKRLPLHWAAQYSSLRIVRQLIENDAKSRINYKDTDGATPLHFAALNKDLQVIDYLVSKGANLQMQDENLDTPLHWAASWGTLDSVKAFRKNKASTRAKNIYKETPLDAAIRLRRPQVINYLKK